MANCNKLFSEYNKVITPSKEQRQQMKKSREALEKKITLKLQEKLSATPNYFTQGSDAINFKTIIIKEDGTYDTDRGVYLPFKPSDSAETVQGFVYDAVKDHTSGGAQHRKKCIRVIYKAEYNIDLPVYYEVKDEDYAYMAVKGNGWIKDDPWHMIKWLEKHKDSDGQLLRVIKFLKGWASKCSCKMPSGIALAVWAARNFVSQSNRDDKSLYETLLAIQNAVKYTVSCISPVEPFDDLVDKLTEEQTKSFSKKLDEFIADAKKAIDEPNELKSSKLWRSHLGDRFPLGVDEDTDQKAAALFSSANLIFAHTAKINANGNINTTSGVPHKIHRNYGS